MEDRIALIHQPALLIRATHDPFAKDHCDELQRHIRHARIVDIEGGMVPLPDQMPHAFAGAVLEFLDSLK